MINGIDYASIDENKPPHIEGSGLSFVIQRASYGTHTDPHLTRDRDSWHAAGVTFGAYMILGYDPKGASATDQAKAFIAAYGDRRPGELPPWLDLETNSADHSAATDEHRLTWAHEAYDVLMARYGIVGAYTSVNQWTENFGNKPSKMGQAPLWLKIPYPWKEHNAPHPESCPSTVTDLPLPWRNTPTAGAWVVQYQGDANKVPGISNQADLDAWLPVRDTAPGLWVRQQLTRHGFGDVRSFQRAGNLVADGLVGPKTFASLTYFA